MTYLFLIYSLLLAFLYGSLIVSIVWKKIMPSFSGFLVKNILALGLGLGITSVLYFIYISCFNIPFKFYALFEFFGIPVLMLFKKLFPVTQENHKNLLPKTSFTAFKSRLLLGAGLFLISSLSIFFMATVQNPQGGWDAIALWNMKAKFLYDILQWKKIFTMSDFFHPDYPLLLPGMIARSWKYMNEDSILVPQLIAFIFTFSTVFLLTGALSMFTSSKQGALASILLTGFPFFIVQGATQCADIPLSFYILSVFVLIILSEKSGYSHFLFLSGICCGLSAFTKNEGLLFMFTTGLTLFLITPFFKIKSYPRSSWLAGITGILPFILFFKGLSPENDIFCFNNSIFFIEKISDFSRWAIIEKHCLKSIFQFNHGIMLLLFISLLLCGVNQSEFKTSSSRILFYIIFSMLLGYFFVYVLTPHNLEWHLRSSSSRLFIQLWPGIIFFIFLVITPIDKNHSEYPNP